MLQQTELFKKVKEYNDHMENNGLSRLALTSREVISNLFLSKMVHDKYLTTKFFLGQRASCF